MDLRDQDVLIAGAGGFIGGHLVADLIHRGVASIRAVDVKPLPRWSQVIEGVENLILDLRAKEDCEQAVEGCDLVINLASGHELLTSNRRSHAASMTEVLINTHLLEASRASSAERYFFASSVPAGLNDGAEAEKRFSEQLCRHFQEDYFLETRVVQFQDVYGPHGALQGGHEKLPAKICRQAVEAEMTGQLELVIAGDGEQAVSGTYIEDCLRGIYQVMLCDDNSLPVMEFRSSESVTMNELVATVEGISGVRFDRRYAKLQEVGATPKIETANEFRERFGWEPLVGLRAGLEKTYEWIYEEMSDPQKRGGKSAAAAVASPYQEAAVKKLKEELSMFQPLSGMTPLRSVAPLLDDDDEEMDDDFLLS